MRTNDAVFAIPRSDGFANISFGDKGNATVQFPNAEGYASADSTKSS